MGIFSLFSRNTDNGVSPEQIQGIVSRSIADTLEIVRLQGGSTGPYTGGVSTDRVMSLTAVWRSVNLLSDTFGGLPFHIYRDFGKGKEPVDNSIARLFRTEPTTNMTAFNWRKMGMSKVLLDGNFYAYIVRDAKYNALELIPILSKVKIEQIEESLFYSFKIGDREYKRVSSDDVFHVKGYSDDGITGKSVIAAHRDMFTIGLSAQNSSKEFYVKGAKIDGILSTDQVLNPDSYKKVKDSWANRKEDRVPLLDGGLKYYPMSLNPQDAQYLQTIDAKDLEIARLFGVPPHMIGIMDRATWNNVESLGIEFAKYTMLPHCINWEQEINMKLLKESEKSNTYSKFSLDGVMRADLKTRYESYKTAINSGFKSINEVRQLEDDMPIEGGNKHFVQGNNLVDINDINGLMDNQNDTK